MCQKRLSQGRFPYGPGRGHAIKHELLAHQLQVLLVGGNPEATRAAPQWRRLAPMAAAAP